MFYRCSVIVLLPDLVITLLCSKHIQLFGPGKKVWDTLDLCLKCLLNRRISGA